MKFLLIFLLLVFIPISSAVTLDLSEIYRPGESVIVEISGNILEPITKNDFELKRVNVNVPVDYDLKKLGDKYFLWFNAPQNSGNYTLYINDIVTTKNGVVTEEDFNQSFEISGEIIEYNIKPVFYITKNDFEFEIFLNQDFDLPVTISGGGEIILEPGNNIFEFDIGSFESGLNAFEIGIYTIPIYSLRKSSSTTSSLPDLRFNPRIIESVVLITEEKIYPITIINDGEEDLVDLELVYDTEIFYIQKEFPGSITAGQQYEFDLKVLVKENVNEIIYLKSGSFEVGFPVKVEYTENPAEVSNPFLDENFTESQQYNCEELQGFICTASQECSGDLKTSSDSASCCIGSCFTPENESEGFNLAWIGWALAALILIVIAIIVGRYLKTKKSGNPLLGRLRRSS